MVRTKSWISHLSKMDLVKYDLVGMADSPEPCDKCQSRDQTQANSVLDLFTRRFLLQGRLGKLVKFWFILEGGVGAFPGGHVALAHAPRRRRAASHGSRKL
jgi:hypothetical protein